MPQKIQNISKILAFLIYAHTHTHTHIRTHTYAHTHTNTHIRTHTYAHTHTHTHIRTHTYAHTHTHTHIRTHTYAHTHTHAAGSIDVKNFKCKHPGCVKNPSFAAKIGESAAYCAQHKKKDYFDVRHRRCAFAEVSVRGCIYACICVCVCVCFCFCVCVCIYNIHT